MTCPQCAQPNPDSVGACATCGASLAGERTMTSGPFQATATGFSASGSPAAAALSRLAPGTLLGTRYEILSVLGEGGMGTVYKAQDRELRRLVALKVIRPEMALRPEILERFKREILLASQVTHRNVLRIHDLGEAGDVKFISMHYVEGANLKALLESEGPLPLERGFALARQIGEALQAAHDAGIVHRDLKPQNILIDRDGNAYIADFGISRLLAEGGTMTETGAILGTVDYMSPEQARGETPDHRGDLYSFGVILYEMFTGTLPFRASTALSVMMKRLHEDAPTLRQARPELPPWLSAVVARALQRDPQDRYRTAGDLLRDLERQRASRSWRRFARPRYLVPAAALAAAAVLAGAGYYLFTRTLAPDAAGGRPPAPAQAIAFLPFENGTGKPALDWTRTGFPALVSNSLREAPDLRLLGGDRTQQTLADLKLPLSGTYTPFDLRRAGSVLGADVLISGVLRRAGDRFQAEARLQRPGLQGMQEIGVEKAEGQGEESIFALADALAGKIGRALKVRSAPARGEARSTTRSVEALKLYSEGLDLARAGRETEAATRLEQATGADPSFALAQALLSRIYDRLGRRDRAVAASDRAIQSLGGVTSHEARLIRARHAILQNRLDQGIAEYRELLRSFPQDTDARFELAATLEQKGDLAAATEELQRCVLLDPKNTQARYILGRLRLRHGDSEEALKIFNDLLASYTQAGNEEGKGTVLLAIGNVHRYSSQYPEAIRYYRESLEIRRAIGDDRGMAAALGGIAKVLRVQGQSAEAIRSSREALDLLLEIGDQPGIAAEWRNLGEVYEDAGKILEAQKCYQESLKIVRDLDDPSLLADNFSSLGYVASALGNYVEAYFFCQEALAKRREIGDKAQVLRSLIDLGLLEQMQGRYEKALAYAAEAMDLVRETGEEAGGVVLATNVGMIHDDQGSYGAAIKSLAEAVERARRIDDKNLLASVLIYLGGTLARLGHLAEAEERLGEAERLVKETHTASLLPELLMGQAEVQGARGDFDRCLKTLGEALRQAQSLGDRRLVILTRLTMGRWSLSENRPAGRSHLKWAEEEARKSALLPLRLRALAYLASASLKGPPTPDSVTTAGQVMGEGKALHLRESLVLASWVLARGALSKGDHKEATRMFLQAGQIAREMAEGLGEPYLSSLLGRADLVRLSKEARAHISRHGSPAEGKEAARLFPKTAG